MSQLQYPEAEGRKTALSESADPCPYHPNTHEAYLWMMGYVQGWEERHFLTSDSLMQILRDWLRGKRIRQQIAQVSDEVSTAELNNILQTFRETEARLFTKLNSLFGDTEDE